MRFGIYKNKRVFIGGYKRHVIKRRVAWLLAFILSVTVFYIFFERIYPNYISRLEIYADNLAVKSVNSALSQILKEGYQDISFVEVFKNDSGMVTSLETNTMAMNRFKSDFLDVLQKKIGKLPEDSVSIPLGSLLRYEIFSGLGPKIKIKIVPNGFAKADFFEEFTDCGINQVKHKVFLNVSFSVNITSATMKKTRQVETNVPVSETIITGEVPYYYGNGSNIALKAD